MNKEYEDLTDFRESQEGSCSMVKKPMQNTGNISIISSEALKFQRYENMSYHKGNLQNGIGAIKLMQDKLKHYLSYNHIEPRNQFHIINPSKEISLTYKNDIIVNESSNPYEIQSENKYFNEKNLSLRYSLSIDSVICSIQFSPDGSLFAFADGRTVFFINSKDGSIKGTCKIPIANSMDKSLYNRSICFSNDSKMLAISSVDNKIIILNISNYNIIATLAFHTNTVSSLAFSKDSKYLYSGGFDGKICLWDMKTMKLIKTIQPKFNGDGNKNEIIMDFTISSDNSYIAVAYASSQIAIIDLMLDHVTQTFSSQQKCLMSIATRKNFYNYQNIFATASQDKTAKIWDLNCGNRCKNSLIGHTDFVISICFSPNDPLILTGSKDKTIKGWDENTGNLLFDLHYHNNTVFKIDHHPTEKAFISCSGDGVISVWDYNIPLEYESPEQQNQ